MSSSLVESEDKIHTSEDSLKTVAAKPARRAKRAKSKTPMFGSLRVWTPYALPLLIGHVLALFAFIPSFITWTNFAILIVTTIVFGQGINLGYHRLLTHRSLQVPKWLEYCFVLLALCCMEETPAKWVSTHRRHHNHSDDHDKDPHSPIKLFFWAHMGWLMKTRNGRPEMRCEDRLAKDLLDDPFYRLMEKKWWLAGVIYLVHVVLFYAAAFAIYAFIEPTLSAAAWTAYGATLWGVVLRTVVVWHLAWSVNSLAHTFGYQTYKTGEQSRNNWLVAMLASGEGWHNNHHHDPASASVQHKWWEFDLTYYHIKLLEMCGLATSVIKPRHIRHKERASAEAADSPKA